MRRRLALLSVSGLIALLFAVSVPLALLLPAVAPVSFAVGERIPSSTVTALPEFVRTQVVEIEYVAEGTAGSSGVFWTELYYRNPGGDWKLYQPPWNPDGMWFGQHGFAGGLISGTIPFDTYYTGGEATYEFYTVGVDRGYWREGAPRDHAKAKTTLDTRSPNLFIGKPSPNGWTKDGMLAWTSTDEVSGLAAVEAILDGGQPMSFPVEAGAKEATGAEDLGLQAEGDHSVSVLARDRAGNEAILHIPFHFDPNAPALTITAPQGGRYLNTDDVEVRWTAGDSASGIASLRLSVDGANAVELPGAATSYLASGLQERTHIVTLAAFDQAGNFASTSVTFGVDVSAPTLEIISPRPDSFSNLHDLQVLWVGSDAVSGIDHFELSLVEADRTSPPIASAAGFTFEAVLQGPDTVRVVALDRAGNRAEASAAVTIDYTAPVVSITSPGAGTTVSGELTVGWSASDAGSGIARTELLLDEDAPRVVTEGTSYRIANPQAGPHVAIVRVWDAAGNVAEDSSAYAYAPGSAQGPLSLPALEFWLLMVLIGAIAVGSAYYAVRRRKRAQV